MIRTTRNGNIILAVSFVLYLASMTSQSGLLLFPIGIILGCFIVNFFGARRSAREIKVEPAKTVHLAEGEKLSQPWRFSNPTSKALGFVGVRNENGPLLRLGALEPGQSASLVPAATFTRRGVHRFSDLVLTSYYPFGLIRVARKLEIPGEVVVYPAVYETRVPAAAGYDSVVGGKFRGQRHSPSGSSFSGVRPLQPNDPLKHIHWKSSAKGFGLMTKTFEEELSGRIGMIVDSGAADNADLLDDCLRAAGSLMFAALDEGHHVEWVELGTLEHRLVPPFSDGHEILDALARIEMRKDCLDEDHLRQAADRLSRKSSVVLVLTLINEAVVEIVCGLINRRRKVTLYVPAQVDLPPTLAGVTIYGYEPQRIIPLSA